MLTQVLSGHPQLRSFKLAMCNRVTDAALAQLPPTLRELNLVCCGGVCGSCLHRLSRLDVLRVNSCPAVTRDALAQVNGLPRSSSWKISDSA